MFNTFLVFLGLRNGVSEVDDVLLIGFEVLDENFGI